jgi:thymidine kinase
MVGVAELVFFSGTMDCGKSTLALQMEHNHSQGGRRGLIFTKLDRAGEAILSSRLGLKTVAIEVSDELDFWDAVVEHRTARGRVDFLVCDEAQFYLPAQVEQLARVVDELEVDVFAFGITTDFRTQLFPGSRRLIELADRVQVLQVEALCWCGARATHNARTLNGVMVVEGEQVVVGNTAAGGVVGYEVLCRRHHMRQMTAMSKDAVLRAAGDAADALPFDIAVRPVAPGPGQTQDPNSAPTFEVDRCRGE